MLWWQWIPIIAAGILLAVVILFVILPTIFGGSNQVALNYRGWKNDRLNSKARKARLERTTWEGLPWPVGPQGELRITRQMLYPLSGYVLQRMDKAYFDRAKDLKVDILITHDVPTGDIIVTWHKPKNRLAPTFERG